MAMMMLMMMMLEAMMLMVMPMMTMMKDDMLTKMTDTVQMVASTPRRLNFLCLVSFDRIPTLYHCNTKVSSGSQMVTAKEGEGELFLRRFLQHTAALVQDAQDAERAEDVHDTALVDANGKRGEH